MAENKILATIAGVNVTEADITEFIEKLPKEQQAHATHDHFRKQVLDHLVTLTLFAEKAKEDKVEESDEYASLIATAKRDILAQLAMRKIIDSVNPSEDQLKAYFEANKAQYSKGESVAARHILVDSASKANDILAQVESGNMAFDSAAICYSTCPSGKQGGDLGEFGRGAMVPEFDKAAFEAEVGKVVGPVKTQFGYHLIQVYKKTEAGTADFEEVKGKVADAVTQQLQNEAYTNELAALKAKYMA